MARTVDIKISFERYDMVPGPGCRTFRRNLMQYGGRSDTRGYSLWDTLVREDEGANAPGTGVQGVAAVPQPGAPLIVGAAAAVLDGQRLGRARLKESANFLLMHIDDDASRDILAQFAQNGPEIFDYVMTNCLVPLSADDLFELRTKIWQTSIKHTVGSTEATVRDLLKSIRQNVLLLAPAVMTNDEIAEIILRAIAKASVHLFESAMDEVNAPAGPIGVVGSRKHQLPPPPAAVAAAAAAGLPPPPNTRDLMAIVAEYDKKWKAAIRSKAIPRQAAIPLPAPSAGSSLEIGRSVSVVSGGRYEHVGALDMARSVEITYGRAGREIAMDELHARRVGNELPCSAAELGHMAGIEVERGTVSTTDWSVTTPSELARAIDCSDACEEANDDEGPGYSVVFGRDADRTAIMEMLCDECGGAGHPRRICPSEHKFRSHAYMIELHTAAKERKDKGGQRGGRRATVRGQKAPLTVGQPRTFSPSARTSRGAQPRRYLPSRHTEEVEEEGTAETITNRSASVVSPPEAAPPAETIPVRSASAETGEPRAAPTPQQPAEAAMPQTASFAGCQSYYSRMDERGRPAEGTSRSDVTGRAATVRQEPVQRVGTPPWAGILGIVLLTIGALLIWSAYLDGGDMNSAVLTVGGATAALRPRALLRRVQVAVDAAGDMPPIAVVLTCLLCVLVGRATGAPAAITKAPARLASSIDVQHLIAAPDHLFDVVIDARNSTLLQNPRTTHVVENEGVRRGDVLACDDSGASGVIFPMSDIELCDNITNETPNVGVEVADGFRLKGGKVGDINSHVDSLSLVCDSFRVMPDGTEVASLSAPRIRNATFTIGLKPETRLLGTVPIRDRDGILSYFNEDNAAGLSDCVRFPDGCYARLEPGGRNELRFRRATPSDRAAIRAGEISARAATQWPSDSKGLGGRSRLGVHASLAHASPRRIAQSKVTMNGTLLGTDHTAGGENCTGCRIGRAKPVPHRKSSARSVGELERALEHGEPSRHANREPSTHGYTFFGQRIDCDMCTTLPKSFPHGFTVFTLNLDRCTNEHFVYFQLGANSPEVSSALVDLERRNSSRLKEGKVWTWYTDNDLAFEGPSVKQVAERLISEHWRSPAGEKNSNPTIERGIGVTRQVILAMGAFPMEYGFPAAPECLWPWGAQQAETLHYFLSTRSHNPEVSPYRFSHPDGPPADLSWAYPMYCDVTVRLQEKDVHGKMGVRGADGVHLGFDWRRSCHFVFLPDTGFLGSFTVTQWRPEKFQQCQGINHDTPVTYREDGGDLRMGPTTVERVPLRRRRRDTAVRAATADEVVTTEEVESGTLMVNAARISDGVKRLEKEGVAAFTQDAVEGMHVETSSWEERVIYGREATASPLSPSQTVEVDLDAPSIRAYKVAESAGLLDMKTVGDWMKHPLWPRIKEEMESEIAGKLANEAWEVVFREPGMSVMKSKWVLTIKLAQDGSVIKIKMRFVGCGYSQVPGKDFDAVSAPTPPMFTLRMWLSIVGEEALWTDHIDAVKAFTQAELDRVLYCDMPDGFAIPGYVLKLLKALEGIKQGAALWYAMNKWAWNKCGLTSELTEPNLYKHATLRVLAAVFADDCGVGYKPSIRTEYLKLRAEYGRLIKIDSPGPDLTVPVTIFIGLDIDRDMDAGTISYCLRTFIAKAKRKYDKVALQTMPTPVSKAKRDAFDKMEKGTEETMVNPAQYMERLGVTGWCSIAAFPEISHYQSVLGSHMRHPTAENHEALDWVLGYCLNNADNPVILGGPLRTPPGLDRAPKFFEESSGLYAVHDSSWGKSPRPQAGHAIMRTNGAVYWSARSLKIIADSTAHAETAEAARAVKSLMFGRAVSEDAGRPVMGPSAALGDNSAVYELIQKEGSSQLTRHFERMLMLVKYAVMSLIVQPFLVGTSLMTADIFTKAVDEETFFKCKHVLHNTTKESYMARKTSRLSAALARARRMLA